MQKSPSTGQLNHGASSPSPSSPRPISQYKLDRDKEIKQKQEDVLSELKKLEEQRVFDSEEKHRAAATVKEKINTWGYKNGMQKNIRTLLSTLHSVLWEGNNWKPIGIADLIDLPAIKRQFKVAMLVVHPDRLGPDATPEQRVAAELIFEALNGSFTRFRNDKN